MKHHLGLLVGVSALVSAGVIVQQIGAPANGAILGEDEEVFTDAELLELERWEREVSDPTITEEDDDCADRTSTHDVCVTRTRDNDDAALRATKGAFASTCRKLAKGDRLIGKMDKPPECVEDPDGDGVEQCYDGGLSGPKPVYDVGTPTVDNSCKKNSNGSYTCKICGHCLWIRICRERPSPDGGETSGGDPPAETGGDVKPLYP